MNRRDFIKFSSAAATIPILPALNLNDSNYLEKMDACCSNPDFMDVVKYPIGIKVLPGEIGRIGNKPIIVKRY